MLMKNLEKMNKQKLGLLAQITQESVQSQYNKMITALHPIDWSMIAQTHRDINQ